jgi:hypothetical protein
LAVIGRLANGVADLATTIGETYGEIDGILTEGLEGRSGLDGPAGGSHRERDTSGAHRAQPSDQHDTATEEVTREELLERARDLNVHGRSSMRKDELAQAVEVEEGLTKEELVERAREAGIEGRSSMTKEELRKALQEAGV